MSSLSRRDFLSAGAALTSAALWSAPARAAEFNYKFGLELREDQPLPKRMTEACKLILEESKDDWTYGRFRISNWAARRRC